MIRRRGSLYRYRDEPVGLAYVITSTWPQFGIEGPSQGDIGVCVAHAVDVNGDDWFGLRFARDPETYWMDANMIALAR